MTKILIAESLDVETLQRFVKSENMHVHYKHPIPANIGEDEIHFSYQPDIDADDIEKELPGYNGLIVRPKEVSGAAITAAQDLRIIVRGGAGLNSIDLKMAAKNDVVVENTPGENSVSTAEFVFALLIQMVANRYIALSNGDVRMSRAGEPEEYQGQELAGKKIAIVGMGNIGLHVAKRAAAFDMEVIYYSPSKKDVKFKRYSSLHKLLEAQADIVTLHLPLTNKTNAYFGKDEFSRMKKGSVLINCARPQLLDVEGFKWALEEDILYSAAIDGDLDLIEPFVRSDPDNKCVITHHIADSTKQAQQKITIAVLRQIVAYFRDGKLINAV